MVEKNITILQDSFSDHLTAVRHGNGRDWWIVVNKDRGNKVYVIHLSTDGIVDVKQQDIGPQWSAESYQGQSVFSPDGRLFARAAPFNNLTVLDFDRCSGIFSNPRWVPMPDNEAFASGVAFSPNSQYLYLTTGEELHQYDVEVQDLASSRILIDTFDGFASPFSTTFYQMRLAPNDKIYMQATNGVNYMHIIHEPNQRGAACDFRQHDLELPSFIAMGAPNIPFFRLYDLQNSPCDTLGINAPTVSATVSTGETGPSVQIAPNPTSSRSVLRFSESYSGNIIIYDGLGRRVYSVQVEHQSAVNLDAGQLPNGLYQIYCDGLRMGMLKWMIYR